MLRVLFGVDIASVVRLLFWLLLLLRQASSDKMRAIKLGSLFMERANDAVREANVAHGRRLVLRCYERIKLVDDSRCHQERADLFLNTLRRHLLASLMPRFRHEERLWRCLTAEDLRKVACSRDLLRRRVRVLLLIALQVVRRAAALLIKLLNVGAHLFEAQLRAPLVLVAKDAGNVLFVLCKLLLFAARVDVRKAAYSGHFRHLLEVIHIIFFAAVIFLLVDGFQLELLRFGSNKEILEVG